jgi:Cu+-exporting ATPase
MLIAINQEYRGMVAVADTVKDSTAAAIKQLHDLNIKVVMLTGDNERTAQAIANEVGIDTIIAQVLPEEKAANSNTNIGLYECWCIVNAVTHHRNGFILGLE